MKTLVIKQQTKSYSLTEKSLNFIAMNSIIDESVTEMVEKSDADEKNFLLMVTETNADVKGFLLPDKVEDISDIENAEVKKVFAKKKKHAEDESVTEMVEKSDADEKNFLLMVTESNADEKGFLLPDTVEDISDIENAEIKKVFAKKKKHAEDSPNRSQEKKKEGNEIHKASVTAVSPKKSERQYAARRVRRVLSPINPGLNPQIESPSQPRPLETPLPAKRPRACTPPSWSAAAAAATSTSREPQSKLEISGVSDQKTSRSVERLSDPPQAVPLKKTSVTVNFGSEHESSWVDSDSDGGVDSDSDDCVVVPAFVSRTQRIFLDFEEDQPPAKAPEVSLGGSSEPTAHPDPPWLPSAQLEPTDMFKFDWRPCPEPPVAPTERREAFTETNCGPTAAFPTPYDAFTAIWDRNFMEYVASECNRYAHELVECQMREGTCGHSDLTRSWQDTDADELYVFFALILMTSLCIKPDLKEYWSQGDILSTPNIAQCMTANRFYLLSRCLHFAPNSPHVAFLPRPEAKIYKIDPLLKHLNCKFQSLYRPGRDIAVDDSLAQWKSWRGIEQYIKSKGASADIRTYEAYECQTGYLWGFKVCASRAEETDVSGMTASHVLELLKGLEYKGHTVWMDKFHNSPALARTLKSLGFDCVGTLRTGVQFIPEQLSNLTESETAVSVLDSFTSGDVDVILWRNREDSVAVLTTFHGAAVHTACGKTEPTAVRDYKTCMSGLDRKDHTLNAYPIERKSTRVWYKKLFKRLLNVSVLNAHILHKRSPLPDSRAHNMNHRQFRRDLITEIIKRHKIRPRLAWSGETQKRVYRGVERDVPVFPPELLQHFPVEYESLPGQKRIRRCCVVCHRRVSSYCPACNVALCAFDCIKKYHEP